MQKSILINTGLLAGSIIGFFLVIEVGLRVTGIQTVAPNPPKIYQRSQNPEISYELKPNLKNEKAYKARVSTDENGFRMHSKRPTPHAPRPIVAVLGDSIAFGYGVNDEETLTAQIEKKLSNFQLATFNLQLINAAVPGYQLGQEIAAYKEKLLPMKPKGVILVFYWNDLDGFPPGILDNDGVLRAAGWEPSEKTCQPIEEGIMGLIPGKCFLDDHSAFYKAFKKLIDLRRSKAAKRERRQEADTEPENVKDENVDTYVRQLKEFSHILPERRYFVIWPDDQWHTDAKPKLIEAALDAGFIVIDLYEIFGNAVPTLRWDTVHPSPEAIEAAAAAIAERFR